MQSLEKEHGLFELVLGQFRRFKEDIRAKVPSLGGKAMDTYLSESDTYLNHVKLRFSLFEFMINHQPYFNQQVLGISQLQ